MTRIRTRSAGAVLALALSTVVVGQIPADAHDEATERTTAELHSRDDAGRSLAELRRTLAPYKDVDNALADGFVPVSGCTESPAGAMGVHFLNPARATAPVDPENPSILVYLPTADGGYELVAAEWFQADVDQDVDTDADRPSLWGRPFDGPMLGHEAGMPVHYDLHVWLFRTNPAGVFAPWNPSVSC